MQHLLFPKVTEIDFFFGHRICYVIWDNVNSRAIKSKSRKSLWNSLKIYLSKRLDVMRDWSKSAATEEPTSSILKDHEDTLANTEVIVVNPDAISKVHRRPSTSSDSSIESADRDRFKVPTRYIILPLHAHEKLAMWPVHFFHFDCIKNL